MHETQPVLLHYKTPVLKANTNTVTDIFTTGETVFMCVHLFSSISTVVLYSEIYIYMNPQPHNSTIYQNIFYCLC